jgi:hypothetical protein
MLDVFMFIVVVVLAVYLFYLGDYFPAILWGLSSLLMVFLFVVRKARK